MASENDPQAGGGLQLEDLLEVVERRRWWLVSSAIGGLLLGGLLYFVLPPRYESSTTILVEPQEVPEAFIKSTVTLDVEQRLNTLRERVTSFSNLNDLIDQVGQARLDPEGKMSREKLISNIAGHLNVEVGTAASKKTSIFVISYSSPDPNVAADVTREIASLFMTENLKARAQQAGATAEFLDRELDRLRTEVAAHEEKMRQFKEERMGSLPSELDSNLRTLDRLNFELSTNLTNQESAAQRIALLNRQISGAAPVTSPGASAGPVSGSLPAMLLDARRQLMDAERVYTAEHPNVKRWRAEVERLEQEVARGGRGGPARVVDPMTLALQRELDQAGLDAGRLRREEERLRRNIASLQASVESTPRMEQDLLTLTRDYDNLQETYQGLLSKKYEAALARNLEQAQKGERFKVLHPPRVPGSPSWPDPLILLPGGFAVALALCLAVIGLQEFRNPSFRSVSRITRSLGIPVVASIPRIENDRIYEETPSGEVDPRLVVFTAPQSAPAEQYRSFVPVLLEDPERRVVLVTSAARGDGKSLTCMNLALTVACDLNRRVLVVDGDLRRPSAHRLLRLRSKIGLSDLLKGNAELADCVLNTKVPNLSLLPAGRAVNNPLALLTSPRFLELIEQARKQYDAVFIDSPPLLPVVDTRFLKKLADLVLFVVRADATPREAAARSLKELSSVAGIVFNQVSPGSFRRHYYYDAYSRYAYGEPPSNDDDSDTTSEVGAPRA